MKNKRNKKLLASFLFALGLSTNQVNVSAKNGQIRDTLADLIWCNSAKNEERTELEKIASEIDKLVTKFNNDVFRNTYKEEANLKSYIDGCREIYNNLKKELAKIFNRRTLDKDKIYSDLALSIQKNKVLSEELLKVKDAQADADNNDYKLMNDMLEFFKNANNLDFGTWSVWKRVQPSLDRLLNNARLTKSLYNELEKKSVTTSIDDNGQLVVEILNSNQTVLGPLLSNDLKSQVRSVSFKSDVSNIKSLVGTFEGFNNLQSINIPASIEEIDTSTFNGCTNLKSVRFLGESLKNIGPGAFKDCVNLESIDIPASIEKIDAQAFDNCKSLSSVKFLGESLKNIGPGAFKDCVNLESIDIPASIEEIDMQAFMGCKSLRSVKFLGNSSLKKINQLAFSDCVNLESIDIPASIEEIDTKAFDNCINLKSVKILGNSLKELNPRTFKNCVKLQSIEIPSSVEVIYPHTFSGCTNLKNVKIPRKFEGGVKSIFPEVNKIRFNYYE